MQNETEEVVLRTQEAYHYLRISRDTLTKCIYTGRIDATYAGKGWRVLKSELDRFQKGEDGR